MRYILFIAAFLISSLAHGQGSWNRATTNNIWNRGKWDSVAIVPRDTSATNNALHPLTGQPVGDYGRIQAKHGLFYFHDSTRNRRMAFYDDITDIGVTAAQLTDSLNTLNLERVTTTSSTANIMSRDLILDAGSGLGSLRVQTAHASLNRFYSMTTGLGSFRPALWQAGGFLISNPTGSAFAWDGNSALQVGGSGSFNGTVSGFNATASNHFMTRQQVTDSLSNRLLAYYPGVPSLQEVTDVDSITSHQITVPRIKFSFPLYGPPSNSAEVQILPNIVSQTLDVLAWDNGFRVLRSNALSYGPVDFSISSAGVAAFPAYGAGFMRTNGSGVVTSAALVPGDMSGLNLASVTALGASTSDVTAFTSRLLIGGASDDLSTTLQITGGARLTNILNIRSNTGAATRYSNGSGVDILYTGTDQSAFGSGSSDGVAYVYGTNKYHVATDNVRRFTVDGSGNVGVGETSPTASFEVKGTSTTTGNAGIYKNSANTAIVTIQNNGTVVINGVNYTSGSGTPEGSISAPVGSWYSDKTNGVPYFKVTGSGNTGWKEIALVP